MKYLVLSLMILPLVANAQTIQSLLVGIGSLIDLIIPFLLSLAVLFFIYNVIQFFIIQSASEDGRKKAKQYILYSLLAFVLIISLWGIINFLMDAVGIDDNCRTIYPDYFLGQPDFDPCSGSLPPNF